MFISKNFILFRGSKHPLISQIVRRFTSIQPDELAKIRNIGIIAHVDAGKTTTTERMLYYSGLTENIGDVDKGNTVTDYMVQERERGITITSSPVQFNWNKHTINLIDTPGHIDFNYEVERSLTVLDGAIVTLDSSAGVEPQTYQVWKQSNNFLIPKLVYLNKMDKPRSDYKMCLDDVLKLKTNSLLMQLPIYDGEKKFQGVIDLISLEKNIWKLKENLQGIVVSREKLTQQDVEFKKAVALKEDLIGKLCEFDNKLADQVLNTEILLELPDQLIVNSIRKLTIQNQIVPVLLGSSYKNIGIQLLMDAITRYLPSPLERNSYISKLVHNQTSGFLFKIKYDKNLGELFFVRVYEGTIMPGIKLLNYSKNKEERIDKLFKVFADKYNEINLAKKGDIVALTGLKYSSNGDFFIMNRQTANQIDFYLKKTNELPKNEEIILRGLKIPEPVIFCSVEAPSTSKELELENALKCLQREDPSFSVIFNKQTNQTILRGMGDLHLQIIKDRIKRDFKLDPYFGDPQIAYLETFQGDIDNEIQYSKMIRDINNNVYLNIRLKSLSSPVQSISNEEIKTDEKILKIIVNDKNDLYRLKISHSKCIEKGIQLALENGPLLGYRVVNTKVELYDFKVTSKTIDTVIISAAYECVKEAFKKNIKNFYLLEPIMKMHVEIFEENYLSVIKEFANRQAIICNHKTTADNQILDVLIPFAQTFNLSSKLRSITSGRVHYTMQIDNYLPVNKSEESKIIEETKFGNILK